MPCSRIRTALSSRTDGELLPPGTTSAALDAHLAVCADCRQWAGRICRLREFTLAAGGAAGGGAGRADAAGTEPTGTEPTGTEPTGTEAAGTEAAGTEAAGTGAVLAALWAALGAGADEGRTGAGGVPAR
jgi:predicted anti-sigma-YlaC factor YlaD